MLSKTSESAVQTLMYLAMQGNGEPLSPREIARDLQLSPTYLAKVTNLLARAGILRAFRGVQGGVMLNREPENITLLQIAEACQGQIVPKYCQEVSDLEQVCAFHRAMLDVHQGLVSILSRWTLADLLAKPAPSEPISSAGGLSCRMAKFCPMVNKA